MAQVQLIDVVYPGQDQTWGVIDSLVSDAVRGIIKETAEAIGSSFNTSPGQRQDCRYACAAWERKLRSLGLDVEMAGGEGVDADVFADYRLVTRERRSGYREGDGLIHRHYWLLIGPERLIFDPTAHQFDARGGVSPDRYTINGRLATATRTP